MRRLKIAIRGVVQGVGFRPFVYRLANEEALAGWVRNGPEGVFIEVEGPQQSLDEFLLRLPQEKPPLSFIQSLEYPVLEPAGYQDFRIRYPFTNCTLCGPRFSIIQALPYDRRHTTMKRFMMCERCAREYEEPQDRRFDAQPKACPDCGPQLALWDAAGVPSAEGDAALRQAADAVRRGEVLALKGIGGFQLLADARSEAEMRDRDGTGSEKDTRSEAQGRGTALYD